jgi:hypothetical protein
MDFKSLLDWFEMGTDVLSLIWKVGITGLAVYAVWFLYKNYSDVFKKFWAFLISIKDMFSR